MADEDNFDIDIYGDDTNPEYTQDAGLSEDVKHGQNEQQSANSHVAANSGSDAQGDNRASADIHNQDQSHISSSSGSTQNQIQLPKQAPIQQGTKRKEGADDRPSDPGATTALLIQDLHWWNTEDDVRGWANQAGCEDELKGITFNEHKVNGKSKGYVLFRMWQRWKGWLAATYETFNRQVYVEMASTQAATAMKHKIDSYGEAQPHLKKPTVTYNPPHINPYKTVPKDVPKREGRSDNRAMSSNFGSQGHNKFNSGGFQGRGGYNNQNRGGMNQMSFQNRNFSNPPMSGMTQGGFGTPMTGFGNNVGGMQQFGNFNNRGGMMGGMRGGMPNRGGRGGMNPGMMGGMGMGGMGNMSMGMPMGGMGGNMNMGMNGMGESCCFYESAYIF